MHALPSMEQKQQPEEVSSPRPLKLSELPVNCLWRFDRSGSSAAAAATHPINVVDTLLQLLQLFVSPQVLSVPPMTTVSFLKQWENYIAEHEDVGLELLLHALGRLQGQLQFPLVDLDPQRHSFYVNIQVAELEGQQHIFSDRLQQSIQDWLRQPSKPVLLLSLTLELVDESHKVFVALKKGLPRVQVLYIDSHGSADKLAKSGQQLFLEHVQPLVGPVDTVLSECPTLQLSEHGGNCVQWFLLTFAMFVCNPDQLFQPTTLLRSLHTNASINILLFSLFLFCEYLGVRGDLNPVFYGWFRTRRHVADVVVEAHREDETMRRELSEVLPVTNCPTYAFLSCPEECVKCQGVCAYPVSAAPGGPGGPCQHGSPLELAQKMVVLCNDLSAAGLQLGAITRPPVLQVPVTVDDFRPFVFPVSGGEPLVFEKFVDELSQVARYQRLYTQFEHWQTTLLPVLRQHAQFVSPENMDKVQQHVTNLAIQVNQVKSRLAQSEPFQHFPVRYLVRLHELYDAANHEVTRLVKQEEQGVNNMIRDTTNYVVAQRPHAGQEAVRTKVASLFTQFEHLWSEYVFIANVTGPNVLLVSFKNQLVRMAPLFQDNNEEQRPAKRAKLGVE